MTGHKQHKYAITSVNKCVALLLGIPLYFDKQDKYLNLPRVLKRVLHNSPVISYIAAKLQLLGNKCSYF
jgi:hypothetical protein